MTEVTARVEPESSRKPLRGRLLPLALVAFSALVVVSWLLSTPAGLLGKADAVGYAICHRIDTHSLFLGGRQLPLCARCTGMYLGALLGMTALTAMGRGRAGDLPRLPLMLVLLSFIGLMGVDGVNSYLSLLLGRPLLYEPQNWLRVVTGTLNGLTLGVLITPIFGQTLWRDWEARPALGRFRELAALVALAGLVIALTLSEVDLVLYPLAVLSAAGVVALLTALDTTVLLVVMRRANRARGWREAWLPVLAGFTLAMIQIALVDAVRFAVFGTWAGFSFPG